ncbi:hypothetical protein DMN91_000798, partial [Ooceraea biroi]
TLMEYKHGLSEQEQQLNARASRRVTAMTSVDSGVETGNDSNDSMIVQHENQQQQPQQERIYTICTPDNRIMTVRVNTDITISHGHDTPRKEESKSYVHTNAHHDVPVEQKYCRTFSRLYRAAKRESLVMENRGLRSNPAVIPERSPCKIHDRPAFSPVRRRLTICDKPLKTYKCSKALDDGNPINRRKKSFTGQLQEMRFAAITSDIVSMEKLLDEGISPNLPDTHGRTPLHYAANK